jgi:CHASE3 domain sensor protein
MLPKHFARRTSALIILGLVLPIFLIGLPAFLAQQSRREVKTTFNWITHTLEVDRAVQALLNSLIDAETGQRGFLLTRRDVYLEPYDAGRVRVGQQLSDLRNLTADNAYQQQRLEEAAPLIRERLELLAETIERERHGDHEGALRLVNSDRGKERMDKIRGVLRLMSDEEQRLLWIRQQRLAKETGRSTVLLASLAAASVACAAAILFLLRRLHRLEPVVTMCANSRTIEYNGEWLSFEEYLRQRFNISTEQGISPAEFERLRVPETTTARR